MFNKDLGICEGEGAVQACSKYSTVQRRENGEGRMENGGPRARTRTRMRQNENVTRCDRENIPEQRNADRVDPNPTLRRLLFSAACNATLGWDAGTLGLWDVSTGTGEAWLRL